MVPAGLPTALVLLWLFVARTCYCISIVRTCGNGLRAESLTDPGGVLQLETSQTCTFHMAPEGASQLILEAVHYDTQQGSIALCADADCTAQLSAYGSLAEGGHVRVPLTAHPQGVWLRVAATHANPEHPVTLEWSTTREGCGQQPAAGGEAASGWVSRLPLQLSLRASYPGPYYTHCVPATEAPDTRRRAMAAGGDDSAADDTAQGHGSQAEAGQEGAAAGGGSGLTFEPSDSRLTFAYAWDAASPGSALPPALARSGHLMSTSQVATSHLPVRAGLYRLRMEVPAGGASMQVTLLHAGIDMTATFTSATGLLASHFRFREQGLAALWVTADVPPGTLAGRVGFVLEPVPAASMATNAAVSIAMGLLPQQLQAAAPTPAGASEVAAQTADGSANPGGRSWLEGGGSRAGRQQAAEASQAAGSSRRLMSTARPRSMGRAGSMAVEQADNGAHAPGPQSAVWLLAMAAAAAAMLMCVLL